MNEICSYKTFHSYECMNGCIYNYYINKGILLERSDIFFAEAPVAIALKEKNNTFCFSTNCHTTQKDFFVNHCGNFCQISCQNQTHAFDTVTKILESNQIPVLNVSTDLLTYDITFQKNHGIHHYITILGADSEQNKLYISDGYTPDFHTFQGWVDIETIYEAWKKEGFGIFLIAQEICIDIQGIKKQARNHFFITIDHYLNMEGSQIQRVPEEQENIYGYNTIINYLKYIAMLSVNDELVSNIEHVLFQIKFKGFLTIKYFINDYLVHYFADTNEAIQYKKILDRWQHFCLLLLKAAYYKKNDKVNDVINHSLLLIKDEALILNEISKLSTNGRFSV